MPRVDHAKLKRKRMKTDQHSADGREQAAVISVTDSGSIKVQLRGDYAIETAIELLAEGVRNIGYRVLTNPTIYFGHPKKER